MVFFRFFCRLKILFLFSESYFFHGTDITRIESIAKNGFDPRLSKTSGLYGTGIYFGNHPIVQNEYEISRKFHDFYF